MGGRGEGRAQDSRWFSLMKILLLCHCVPFGLANFHTLGIQFRRWPWGQPSGGTSEKLVCFWLSRTKSSGAWSKKEKKRTFSFKRKKKKRREERIFAEFLKIQFVDSSRIYVERNFSPSNCVNTGIFVKLLTTYKDQKLSLVVSTYCLQEQNTFFYPFMKNDKWRREGMKVIWSGRWVVWCGGFCKKSLLVLKTKKKIIHPEFILSWQEQWFSVFRYCGKWFLAFFSDFIPPPLF